MYTNLAKSITGLSTTADIQSAFLESGMLPPHIIAVLVRVYFCCHQNLHCSERGVGDTLSRVIKNTAIQIHEYIVT